MIAFATATPPASTRGTGRGHSVGAVHTQRRRRVGLADRSPLRRQRRPGGPELDVPRRARGAFRRSRRAPRLRRSPAGERLRGARDRPGTFPYQVPVRTSPGSVVVDDGSFTGVPLDPPAAASNAVLVGAKRSQTKHPLFVAGPQVGYFFPQFFAEMELAGAGFATRGAVFPESRSSWSDADPTSHGARPRRRPTTSTSSSRPSATTIGPTSTAASASRCAASSSGR